MSKRDDILSRIPQVDRIPAAVEQAVSMLKDPNADLGKLAEVVGLDPGITASLLRMVNSSYFGAVREISTVREAVIRLGASRVCQLVISVGVASRAKKPVKGYDLPAGELLHSSVATAAAAEELASLLDITPPEHTFTSGLLSNIGKTVLGEFLEVDAAPILRVALEEQVPFEEAERRVLGIDHAEVGAALLEHWNLPEPIVRVVRYKLEPDGCPVQDTALDLVHAGDVMAKMGSMGLGVDGLLYVPSQAVYERLGLTTAIIEGAMAMIVERVQELRSILGAPA